MRQQRILCTVDNCHYWNQGNECYASEILVTSDSLGDSAPDRIDAASAKNLQVTPVDDCMQTACKTFAHEKSAKVNADNVLRY